MLIQVIIVVVSNTDAKITVGGIESQQRKKYLEEWLRPANPSDNANRAKDLRYEGTGTWFLNSSTFKDWLEHKHRHLCLYGAGGCGKTVLTYTILEHLRKSQSGAILYFFFDFSDARKRTLDGLLRSLLSQLYAIDGDRAKKLDALRMSPKDDERFPDTNKLSEWLQDILETFDEVTILMDALDECKKDNKEQKKLIEWIVQIGSAASLKHVKIITTARREPAFRKWLDPELADANCVELAKDSIKADIESYVKGYLNLNPGFHTHAPDHPIVKQIPDRLIRKADGM